MNKHFQEKWEQRWHPLRQEWVVYSAHRNVRPWSGASAKESTPSPEYDPTCYLCPGNPRAGGEINPHYTGVYSFDNDYPVVGPEAPDVHTPINHADPLLFCKCRANGLARVVCYDPRHNVTLAEIATQKVAEVFYAWRDQMLELQQNPEIQFVLIFENRGEIVGVSNPHPHCQIYATNFVFSMVEQELKAAREYREQTSKNIFSQILSFEESSQERMIVNNDHAFAFIPFFARWAYEVLIFPKKRHPTLASMEDEELYGFAQAFQEIIRRYDSLYNMAFPYVMSILQAPVDHREYPDYHLHLLLQPPLRRPGLQKFPAGPEIGGGNFMADTMPEEKAAELQQVDIRQYEDKE